MAHTAPEIERAGNLLSGTLVLFWMGRGLLSLSQSWRDAAMDSLHAHGVAGEVFYDLLPVFSVLSVIAAGLIVWRPASGVVLKAQLLLSAVLGVSLVAVSTDYLSAGFGGLPRLIMLLVITVVLLRARLAAARPDVADRGLRMGLAFWLLVTGLIGWFFPASAEVALMVGMGFDPMASGSAVQGVALLEIFAAALLCLSRPGSSTQSTVLWSGLGLLSVVPVLLIVFAPRLFFGPTTPHMAGFCPMGAMAVILFAGDSASIRRCRRLEGLLVRSRRIAALQRQRSSATKGWGLVIAGVVKATETMAPSVGSAGILSSALLRPLAFSLPRLARFIALDQAVRLVGDLKAMAADLQDENLSGIALRSLAAQLEQALGDER